MLATLTSRPRRRAERGLRRRGVGGFTLGSFDLCLLPFDPDAEQLACLPGPRDPDPLRTASAQGCQQPKPKTRSGTRAQKHARAQAFTNHAQLVCASQLWYPWRQEIRNAGAQAAYDLRVRTHSTMVRCCAGSIAISLETGTLRRQRPAACACARKVRGPAAGTLPRICAAERGPHHCSSHHRCTGSGHGVQLRQVPRQLRHVLPRNHWSSQVLSRSPPRGVGLHET